MVSCIFHNGVLARAICQRCNRPICEQDENYYVLSINQGISHELLCCPLCISELTIQRISTHNWTEIIGSIVVFSIFLMMVISIIYTAKVQFTTIGFILSIFVFGASFIGINSYFGINYLRTKYHQKDLLKKYKEIQQKFLSSINEISGIITVLDYFDPTSSSKDPLIRLKQICCHKCKKVLLGNEIYCTRCGYLASSKFGLYLK